MWIMDIPTKVLTRLRVELKKTLSEYYPDLNVTDEDKQSELPKFPTVYVQDLGGPTHGRDIDGKSINAVMPLFQIDVTDNKRKANAREVMNEVLKVMTKMRFEVATTPHFEKTQDNTYRMVARFRRMIGYNDTW